MTSSTTYDVLEIMACRMGCHTDVDEHDLLMDEGSGKLFSPCDLEHENRPWLDKLAAARAQAGFGPGPIWGLTLSGSGESQSTRGCTTNYYSGESTWIEMLGAEGDFQCAELHKDLLAVIAKYTALNKKHGLNQPLPDQLSFIALFAITHSSYDTDCGVEHDVDYEYLGRLCPQKLSKALMKEEP